jgi:SAM-dependent methyltransferase
MLQFILEDGTIVLAGPVQNESQSRPNRLPCPEGTALASLLREGSPSLDERSEYKKVWDRQTGDIDAASLAVGGFTDEANMEETGRYSVGVLKSVVGVGGCDVVLEIGCGIGRVGKVISRECLHWFGADISGGMLRHAASRLAGCPNTTLVELSTVGLQEFPCDSFDLVYCTIVFMHLFEWDRYRYVEEAYRVLRPGGRCYFDNFHLESESGWRLFLEGSLYPLSTRPAHISMASTKEEFVAFLTHAGFDDVCIYELPNELIAGTGLKPTGS